MSVICIGTTNRKRQCRNKVMPPNIYCRIHCNSSINNVIDIPLPKRITTNNTNNIDNIDEIINCPICLCDIDINDEDTGLICNHRFHVECLNKVEKSECPVCRGPLESLNSSKVDFNNIKIKEYEEKIKNNHQLIVDDEEFCRNLVQYDDDNHHNIAFDMSGFLNFMLEMEEMENFSIAIQNSINHY